MFPNEVSVNVYDHGTVVDKQKGRIKCNYCGKFVSGSSRLKYHLGGIRGDVTPCDEVPEAVKEVIKNVLLENKKGYLSKEVGELDHPNLPWKRNWCHQTNSAMHDNINSTSGSGSMKHVKMESISQKNLIKSVVFPDRSMEFLAAVGGSEDSSLLQAKQCIGTFFYETGIEFNAAIIPSLRKMINSTLGCGEIEHMIPSCQELKGWILQNELKEMQHYVQHIRSSWASTGCSILLDGWIDEKGRELLNILVDCPKGTIYLHSFDISAFVGDIQAMTSFLDEVLREVGVDNVVQIISYSTSVFMQTLGQQLMDKHQTIFWTVSASHCIEMMLEEMGMMSSIKETLEKAKKITKFIYNDAFVLKLMKDYTHGCDLVKPSKFRSATPFVTLENIMLEMDCLRKMFTSPNWNTSIWASREEGKRVADLVIDYCFWSEVRNVLNATIPLVRVLDLINEGDSQLLGYIYETMDQAKEAIKEEFKNKKSQYMPFWEVIDSFWNNYLHSPLHSAGYFLNSILFYSTDFLPDMEVVNGLLCCIVRMAKGTQLQHLITTQLDSYRETRDDFQYRSTIAQLSDASPALWWSRVVGGIVELQTFASRILSQTCNGASRYALNRSLAEKLLTEGRNRLEQQGLSNLTFLHYNMQLRNFNSRVPKNLSANEIDPMDDWIVDEGMRGVIPK